MPRSAMKEALLLCQTKRAHLLGGAELPVCCVALPSR